MGDREHVHQPPPNAGAAGLVVPAAQPLDLRQDLQRAAGRGDHPDHLLGTEPPVVVGQHASAVLAAEGGRPRHRDKTVGVRAREGALPLRLDGQVAPLADAAVDHCRPA